MAEIIPTNDSVTVDEAIKKELQNLGLEINPENVGAVGEQMRQPQFPEGYDEVLDNLDSPNMLKAAMEQRGITSIVHAEGKTVWDHVRLAIELARAESGKEEEKRELAVMLLYHDLGKTESSRSPKNVAQTEEHLKKGELHSAAIGHAKMRTADIERGLKANGIDASRLPLIMKVLESHMETSLLEQDPKKTVALFNQFGNTKEERMTAVRLLTTVLRLDGQATQHIRLKNGQLEFSNNVVKTMLTFDQVWAKYEEGEKILRQENESREKKKAEEEHEKAILGKRLSEYLMKDRGVKPGPLIGEATSIIKATMKANINLPPEDIKKIIDSLEFPQRPERG